MIKDTREYFWSIDEYYKFVLYAKDKNLLFNANNNDGFRNYIINGKTSIYKEEMYTLIEVDTNTNDNRYLQIFDNNKEIPFRRSVMKKIEYLIATQKRLNVIMKRLAEYKSLKRYNKAGRRAYKIGRRIDRYLKRE